MGRIIRKLEQSRCIFPKRKRVAAYTRVSSGKEAMLHSLSAQVSYYSEIIQNNPQWEYAGVYIDEAMTGTKDLRAEFQRMIADCKAGKIDMIITKSVSRFARNTVTMLEIVRELKTIGVDVFFEKENIHSMSGDGELMLTILSSFAQEESLSVSENCKWRIRDKFKQGIPVNFKIFGYKFENGILKVNPEEAEIVKKIFNDYADGKGFNLIAKELNEMGVRTLNGKEWRKGGVERILKNEKYLGDMLLQKVYSSDHLTKRKCVNNGELPRYLVKDDHEPIIDRSTFDKVQNIMKLRSSIYGCKDRGFKTYPFSGKIKCGTCGKNFRRKTNNAGTKYEKTVWICTTYDTKGKKFCNAKQIPEHILIELINSILEISDFDQSVFEKKIREIYVPEQGSVVFKLNNGQTIKKLWSYDTGLIKTERLVS